MALDRQGLDPAREGTASIPCGNTGIPRESARTKDEHRQRLKRATPDSPRPARPRSPEGKGPRADRHRGDSPPGVAWPAFDPRGTCRKVEPDAKTTVRRRSGLTIRRETRGLVWNLARARSAPMVEQARRAAFFHRREDQPGWDRRHPPQGGERREQTKPEVRHTRDPRDHLDSFGNVVGAGPSRPPRLASLNHLEERAFRKSQHPSHFCCEEHPVDSRQAASASAAAFPWY